MAQSQRAPKPPAILSRNSSQRHSSLTDSCYPYKTVSLVKQHEYFDITQIQ